MKSLLFVLLSTSKLTYLVYVLGALLALTLIVLFINYLRKKGRQSHPLGFTKDHIDHYFKVIEVNKHKEVVLLGIDACTERPFGTSEVWFYSGPIPKELLEVYHVIKVEGNATGGITFNKGPNF